MLIAASRKRVIGAPCGNPPFPSAWRGPSRRTPSPSAAGADIVRVHDVREAVQAARVTDAILRGC